MQLCPAGELRACVAGFLFDIWISAAVLVFRVLQSIEAYNRLLHPDVHSE